MAKILFKNNAYSTLAAGITDVATTLSVQTGHGDRFPTVTGTDIAYITLEDGSGNREIVKVTARSGGADSMTIVRAQEGTSARAWLSGDVVEQRVTAAELGRFEQLSNVEDSSSKATPVDDDMLPLKDSAASNVLKYLTWANLKTALGSTFAALAGSVSQAFSAASIELGHASDTTLTRVSAGVIAVEGATVALESTSRVQTCWIPAGAMVARTTNGAASGTVETTTNKNMIKTLDFDATTAEYAQFSINMPKGWDEGTITAAFVWSHAATATNFGVAWELAGVAVSDDDALDVAFGTAQTVTDTGGTTNDAYITAATSAITIAGSPAANDLVMFQVNRAPANGSDTMAIDARLHGVRLMYSINTLTDA